MRNIYKKEQCIGGRSEKQMELEAQIKACDDQIAKDEKQQEENNALEEDRKKQMELEAQIKACDDQIAKDEKHTRRRKRN